MSRIGCMGECLPHRRWRFPARALGYRNQVRRYVLLVATLWPIAYMLFFMAVIAIAATAGGGDHRILILLGGLIAMPIYR